MIANLFSAPGRFRVADIEADVQIVVSADGIGDHLLGLTASEGLRKTGRKVVYVAKPSAAPWVALFGGWDYLTCDEIPGIPKFVPHDTYKRQMADKTKRPRWEYYAEVCGAESYLPALRKPLPPPPAHLQGRVLLSPFSSYRDREWPLTHWFDLERLLLTAGHSVAILDGPGGRSKLFISEKLCGEPAALVASAIGSAACLIGNDSGMVHLAGLLGAPAIALCGLIRGENLYGIYPNVMVINGPLSCTGCHWRGEVRAAAGCTNTCFSLAAIRPEDVMALVPVRRQWTFPAEELASKFSERDRAECLTWLPRYEKLWEVLQQLQPRRIVEIGVRAGYSAWTMLEACPEAVLHGIDADFDGVIQNSHDGYQGACRHAVKILDPRRFTITIGDSHNLTSLPECDLVYIDGDHTKDGCGKDLLLAERSGSRFILLDDYDTADLGVRRAVDDFMAARHWLKGRHIPNGSTGLYLIERPQ